MPFVSLNSQGGLQYGGQNGVSLMQQPGVPARAAQVFLRERQNELYRRARYVDEEVSAEVGVVFGSGEIGEGQDVRSSNSPTWSSASSSSVSAEQCSKECRFSGIAFGKGHYS